eukprot:3009684-Pleurochrysis_carterae.AAC.10
MEGRCGGSAGSACRFRAEHVRITHVHLNSPVYRVFENVHNFVMKEASGSRELTSAFAHSQALRTELQ